MNHAENNGTGRKNLMGLAFDEILRAKQSPLEVWRLERAWFKSRFYQPTMQSSNKAAELSSRPQEADAESI